MVDPLRDKETPPRDDESVRVPRARDADYWRRWVKEAFDLSFWIFLAAATALGTYVFQTKGEAVFLGILEDDLIFLAETLPRILVALLVAGLVRVMLPTERVTRLIGQDSGVRGLMIATLAGCVTPGGPVSVISIFLALAAAGADRGALMSYFCAWSMLSLQRVLVWELPFMGEEFAVTRIMACLPLAVLTGAIARRLPLELRLPESEPVPTRGPNR